MFSYPELMPLAPTRPQVGRAVRLHRESKGISLRELAARIDVSPATLSAVENGNTALSVERMCRIAEELALAPARLLEQVEDAATGDRTAAAHERADWPDLPSRDAGRWRDFADLPLDPALAGALEAFCDKGFHGASIRDIADCAGLSVAGLYHYHRSKQAMLPALLDLTMADLFWRLDAAREGMPRGPQRLHRTVECLALYHARRPRLAFLGASEMRSLSAPDRRRITLDRKAVQRMVEEDIRASLQGNDGVPRRVVTLGNSITTMCTSISQWIRPDGPISPEQIAADYADAAVAMVGHRPPGHLSSQQRKVRR